MPRGCRACALAGGASEVVYATGTDTYLEFDDVYIANNKMGANASGHKNLFTLGLGTTTLMARTRIVGNTVAADGRAALA